MNYGVHVYYCSKACQQSDWKVHKKICGPKPTGGAAEDEKTKAEQHRNAMGQLLQRLSGRSLPAMPRAEGIHAFDPRTGEWVNFGTGTDGMEAMMKTQKDRSGGRE